MRILVKLVLVAMTLSFAACGTVAGFGDDIKNTANWTKDKMSGK